MSDKLTSRVQKDLPSIVILLFLGIALLATSCGRPYTSVSGVAFYPTNSNWNSALYVLRIRSDGEPGKKYSDFGEKHVFVTLFRGASELTQKKYILKAANLSCKVNWPEMQSVQILFSEGNATNVLRSISLKIDNISNQVTEVISNKMDSDVP